MQQEICSYMRDQVQPQHMRECFQSPFNIHSSDLLAFKKTKKKHPVSHRFVMMICSLNSTSADISLRVQTSRDTSVSFRPSTSTPTTLAQSLITTTVVSTPFSTFTSPHCSPNDNLHFAVGSLGSSVFTDYTLLVSSKHFQVTHIFRL